MIFTDGESKKNKNRYYSENLCTSSFTMRTENIKTSSILFFILTRVRNKQKILKVSLYEGESQFHAKVWKLPIIDEKYNIQFKKNINILGKHVKKNIENNQ